MNIEINNLIENIENKEQVRQALSQLRALIKEDGPRQYFMNAFTGRLGLVVGFLESTDPKTRKNAALLLGDISDMADADKLSDCSGAAVMAALYRAYIQEQQLFVKSAYLNALGNYDYRPYINRLIKRKEELSSADISDTDIKHIREELHVLDSLIISMQGLKKHEFTGEAVMSDVVLLTNRRHVAAIASQAAELLNTTVEDGNIKLFSAGVLIHTDKIRQLMALRTFHEMLYQVKGMTGLPMNASLAAKRVAESSIIEFLRARHSCTKDMPFYFRLELKSNMDLGAKSTFVKKMSYEIEKLTNNKLINNKSNYEIEIRLIETKSGKFNCMVKLYTCKDNRFDYRKKSVAASIKPENAALLVELSKEYMKEDARVLDPFCGTGTMLIERQKAVKANTSYGIDIYGEAIEGARVNTEAAGQIIHYINKDYFEFEHSYLFDEIFTYMPYETGNKDKTEISQLYQKFFTKALSNLTADGRIILYTHNREMAEQYAKKAGFKILAHEIILEKAGTDLYVFEA
ncbi:MAG: methyltransferase [Eubacteriales bacterium]|nr:methyltransferase [Eubacteriales bacterium]